MVSWVDQKATFSSESHCWEYYLSEKRNIIANAEKPSVRIANGHVNLKAAIKVVNGLMRNDIHSSTKMMRSPNVYREPGIARQIVDEQFDLYARRLLGCKCGYQAERARAVDPKRAEAACAHKN